MTYTGIYGSLGVLPLFLVGLYFSWLILLFGAQTAYTFQYRKIYLQERIGEQVSQFQRELFALRIMAEIGRRFHLHLNPTSAADIAVKNGIPSRLCGQLVQALATDRLLIENGGAERTLTPAKPLDQITVSHILDVVRGSTQVESNSVESDPDFVLQEFESVQFAAAEKGKLTTLKDLVGRLSA